MRKPLIGAHLSYKKDTQLFGTVKDALLIGATSGAFYISNSRGYTKFDLNNEMLSKAKKLAKDNNFDLNNFIVHSPLVGNLANLDKDSNIFENTLESYTKDVKTMNESGIKYFNFHPGSASNKEKGIIQIAKGINKIHKNTEGHKTILLLETMMPKGNYIGKNFDELKKIIDLVEDKKRIGICIDTCHIWDAGYDIKNDLEGVLDEFDEIIGLKYLKALHINDSKNELGSGKDRHEAIGEGKVGLRALRAIVNHPKLKDLPKALETPYGKDDFKRWKNEMKLLID